MNLFKKLFGRKKETKNHNPQKEQSEVPDHKNSALLGVAYLLTDSDKPPTYKKELLDPQNLDFSPSSITKIEDYINEVKEEDGFNSIFEKHILRLGAYLGEVIKQNSEIDYNWYEFETLADEYDFIASYGNSIETCSILHSKENGSFLFPISRVHNFIDQKEEKSLTQYVEIGLLNGSKTSSKKLKYYADVNRKHYQTQFLKLLMNDDNGTVSEPLLAHSKLEEQEELYSLFRPDFLNKKEENFGISEFNSETYINHQIHSIKIQNTQLELYPFYWNSLEIIVDGTLNEKELIQWGLNWIDSEDKKQSKEFEIQNVIHSILRPEKENKKTKLSIDLGTSPSQSFIELIELLVSTSPSFIKIGSFSMIDYEES